MSGHSKWHNIQARKGKQDQMKANAFTKVGRAISVAARSGGGDPAANFSLRLAIEKAKEVNFPKDNIDRAIKKGTGELEGAALEEPLYEGFGSGGIGILVDVVTDNKNRTAGEIKNIFAAHGGSFAGTGSVAWQFRRLGVIRTSDFGLRQSDIELALIDAGAEDILYHEEGVEIRCPVASFQKVLETIQSLGVKPDDAALEWVPKETVALSDEASGKVQALVDALQNHDDVRAVFTNA